VRQNARRHEQAVHDLQQLLGRDPAEGEVAAHLRVDRHTYCTIRRDAQPTEVSSLQATRHRSTTGEADAALAQVVADHRLVSPIASAMRNEMRDMICQSLSPAQRLIITLYYFEGMTMKEIGRTMNLSESRVSQMHATILARIRSRLKRLNLADITDVLDDAAA
jgi:RNA polymerase sigma factor for flagellar operon FliA